jgi:hypothetical protein
MVSALGRRNIIIQFDGQAIDGSAEHPNAVGLMRADSTFPLPPTLLDQPLTRLRFR